MTDRTSDRASAEERRIVTVLFADVEGSTALGEELDPEEMRRLLGRYYSAARDVIHDHGGTVEKFIGDAVMAVFGLPSAHGDDAERALAAAIVLRRRIQTDGELAERLTLRFGVSTGEVVASVDQSAGDFLITGDAVNVAARLQQAADPWAILVSERTVSAARSAFEFGDQVQVIAKGKSAPVTAREVVRGRLTSSRERMRVPLIGRENDLDQLRLVARRAFGEGRPSLVSVIAPAGTGKTRLLEEFLDWLPELAPHAVVATAQCLPYGQQLTYWPMRQVLYTLTGSPEDAPPAHVRDAIKTWLLGLGLDEVDRDANLLAATVGVAAGEGVDRDALFAAWRSALEAAAKRNPLVIVFEDLHWSSDSLLDLAEFVMQPRGDAGVLMVALARPELLDRRPTWGGGRRNHLALTLEPLGDTDIADLVRHLLDADDPAVIEFVAARSEGNPFYAGELVRSFLEQRSLERLPDTVQATVLARLDLLPAAGRRMIQLGSVYGRSFRPAGVAALEPHLAGEVAALCEDLADRDLIRPDADRFVFRHILIQEVAYGTLPRTERARLHAAAGRWVEAASEGREAAVAEILAFHFREAAVLSTSVDPNSAATLAVREAAGRWLVRAGETAAGAEATREAVRHFRAAFDFIDRRTQAQLHERIADLTAGDSGLDDYRKALDLYEDGEGSADDRLRALAGMLMILMRWQGSVGGRPSVESMTELRAKGRALLLDAQDKLSIGRFLAADAFYPYWLEIDRPASASVIAEAEASASQAIAIASELGDPGMASAALDALGGAASASDNWPRMLELTRQRIEFGDRINLYERLDAYAVAAWISVIVGDLAGADVLSARMVARLLPGQAPYASLHLFAWRTLTLTLLGRLDDATVVFWRAIESWNDAGRLAAGYALRGFIPGLDIGRARGDVRVIDAASDVIRSILSRFPEEHPHLRLNAYLQGTAAFTRDDPSLRKKYSPEMAERRLALAADNGEDVPGEITSQLLQGSINRKMPLLEAQVRRCIGLASRDAGELSSAMRIWEGAGALPNLARARAERGRLIGDQKEVDAGLDQLRSIGDIYYVDRFATQR